MISPLSPFTMKPSTRASLLAFLTAFVALAVQVLVHRMVSVKLVNNYAFLVISLSMLGFAVSGVVLSRWLEPLLARRDEVMAASAALFGLSFLGRGRVLRGASRPPVGHVP